MISAPATTAQRVAWARGARNPTASLVDGPLDIKVFDVHQLHDVFERVKARLGPFVEMPGVIGLSIVVRAREVARGGSHAVEIEVVARTVDHPISIRCVRQSADAAIELAAIVLKLRLTSSDRPDGAALI